MASRTPSSRLAMMCASQSACLPCVPVCAAQAFRWVVGYRRLALATDVVVFVYLLCSPIRELVPLSFRVGLAWHLLASLSVVRWGGVRSRDGAVANKTNMGPVFLL